MFMSTAALQTDPLTPKLLTPSYQAWLDGSPSVSLWFADAFKHKVTSIAHSGGFADTGGSV